jgi:pilus assembly protein CpaE
MSAGVRVIIYTSQEEYAVSLRQAVLGIKGVRIAAEVDDIVLLAQATERFNADVVLVDLDPRPDEALPVAGALAMERPDLSVFAISESTDGQLILSAMRSGINEFLTKPIDNELLGIAFEKVASHKDATHIDGKLLTVIGSSGGVGATTLSCNLAVELADMVGANKVALVDLDYRFGQVATLLDVQPNYTIADLAESAENIEASLVESAMVQHESGVHVLARPNQFAQADMITAAHCGGVLSKLQDMYEYVIVDGPTRFDMGTKTVLDIADLNLLLIQLLVTSVRNVHRIVEEMRAIGFNLDRVKIVANRVGKDSGIISPEYVKETLNHEIYYSLPDDWASASGSINMGVALNREYAKSKLRLAIRELAERIHEPQGSETSGDGAGGKKGGGLLTKMFSKG